MLTIINRSSILKLVQDYLDQYFSVEVIPELSLTISKKVRLLSSIHNLDFIKTYISDCKNFCILKMQEDIQEKPSINAAMQTLMKKKRTADTS